MLTIKAFHIILVVSWFAGLFYLPRIYVNLAAITDTQSAEYQRLLGMSRRLYRFVTPIGLGAVILGLWLWFGYGFAGGWLHAKTLLVVFLLGYHFTAAGSIANLPRVKTPTAMSGTAGSMKSRYSCLPSSPFSSYSSRFNESTSCTFLPPARVA